MNGCPDDNALAALADAALSDAERLEIETHLDTCARCSEMTTALAWVMAPPRASPPRYRLVRGTERGWLAVDTHAGGEVEIRFAALGGDGVARLERSRAAAAVQHPRLVPILDMGVFESELFVATAAGVLQGATPARTLEAWRDALAGVMALHDAGLAHGALEPDALVSTPSGVLVDRLGEPTRPASGYVAPELLVGGAPTPAADQFALCAIAWELCTGQRPYRSSTIGGLAVDMKSRPRPIDGDHALRVLARGLDPEPTRRWPDLATLDAALARPGRDRRRVFLLIAGALAALIAIGVYWWS